MKRKILFFGTPEIAVPSLEAIAALNNLYDIVGVGVFPDRKVGRKQILTPCPVKVAAQRLELPIFELESKAELKTLFHNVECDLALVIAFGLIFPATVLKQPPFGVVNVHFSLLPAYRGASPVQAAILDGLSHTGITWQKMVRALDAGDVLWQTKHDITHQTTAQVWQNFAHYTAEAFPEFLAAYFGNNVAPHVQDERLATFCGKFEKQDGYLQAQNHTAAEMYNRWRAFQPWPGVSFESEMGLLKLNEVYLEPPPEKAVEISGKDHTTLFVTQAQIPGKKTRAAHEIQAIEPRWFQAPSNN